MSTKIFSNADDNVVFDVTPDTNPVLITIVIGEGQIGGSSIMVDSTIIINPEPVIAFSIGNGNDIQWKILHMTTTVSKYSPSDFASVIVTISQGGSKQSFWNKD